VDGARLRRGGGVVTMYWRLVRILVPLLKCVPGTQLPK